MMSQKNKVGTPGNIPFSWENKPGISKVQTHRSERVVEEDLMVKLPPPPCPSGGGGICVHDFQIPLPPVTFQPPLPRSSSARGLRKYEDPFLAAYEECTKSTRTRKVKSHRLRFDINIRSRLRSLFVVSCKSRASVLDDSLVRVSELPYDRERNN